MQGSYLKEKTCNITYLLSVGVLYELLVFCRILSQKSVFDLKHSNDTNRKDQEGRNIVLVFI